MSVQESNEGPNPSGLCMCGCGQPAPIAKHTDVRDQVIAGKPSRYLKGHHTKGKALKKRYEVNPITGCWEWLMTVSPINGYGVLGTNSEWRMYAHVYYYRKYKGVIPEGLILDHLCRVRHCCNPEHLEPVTQAENVQRGNAAKLNPSNVVEIRTLHEHGSSGRELASNFNVSTTTIYDIVNRKSWKNVA